MGHPIHQGCHLLASVDTHTLTCPAMSSHVSSALEDHRVGAPCAHFALGSLCQNPRVRMGLCAHSCSLGSCGHGLLWVLLPLVTFTFQEAVKSRPYIRPRATLSATSLELSLPSPCPCNFLLQWLLPFLLAGLRAGLRAVGLPGCTVPVCNRGSLDWEWKSWDLNSAL